jgi:hypothetical protein
VETIAPPRRKRLLEIAGDEVPGAVGLKMRVFM